MEIYPHLIELIEKERDYQERKYPNHGHELPGWLLIMHTELAEAEDAWMKSTDHESLAEVLQVIATGVAALQSYSSSDISYVQQILESRWKNAKV